MLNNLGRLIQDLASLIKPLSDLLKSDVVYQWGEPQQEALEAMKKPLTSLPPLEFYRCDRPTIVTTDASSYGLEAVLLQ